MLMAARKAVAKPAVTKKAAPKATAAKKAVRRPWSKDDVRALKTQARQKVTAEKIAKALKRTEGATRQKAFSEGISLDSRR
jgi:NACalpha-BTF3-like transcription factor